jgi:hypothetical protein
METDMDRRISKSWAIGAGVLAMVIAGSPAAHATERITVNVPFPFIVSDVLLPPGDYVVQDAAEGSGILAIESADGRLRAVASTIPFTGSVEYPPEEPKLAFREYEGRRFLARVTDGAGDSREVPLDAATMTQEIASAEGSVE